jgi:cysteine-S-conjugate beta-lyase
MSFDFDRIVERKGSSCIKHDGMEKFLGAGDVLPMWVADMDFLTPGYITEAIIERAKHGVFGYPLREESYFTSLIDWLDRRHGWRPEKEWISFCPGVVPAVNLAVLALTQPGDAIITQPPVYFPFFTAVTDHKRVLLHNRLVMKDNRLCMDFDNLEELARSGAKMLILSNPHNPGGSVWTRDELRKMADICLKYNVLILSDEIHCDLLYKPFKHTPVASLSEEISMQTITTVAPSKTFNLSGFSTASVIIQNDSIRRRFNAALDHLHIGGGNIFGNIASEQAYLHGDEYVDELMDYLDGNVNILEKYAQEHLPLIRVIRPESTFLVWLDCRAMGLNDEELRDFFLKKAKVGFNPGIMFGPGGEGFMRMNIGCPAATLLQALEQIRNAFGSESVK